MNDAKGQQEPSMEEILASIRRIISEDTDGSGKPQGAPAPAPTRATSAANLFDDDDVMELNDRADAPAPHQSSGGLSFGEDDFVQASSLAYDDGMDDDDGLMSAGTVGAAASAFSMLEEPAPRPAPPRPQPAVSASSLRPGLTVEELVHEALKPLLRQWLDQNLPEMVEQLVRSEIERVSKRR